jgi:hypothetical protein
MKSEASTAALLRYNADRSEQKRRDVQTALAELAEDPSQPINKSNVARRAGVSREFINSHPDLGRLIETAARQAATRPCHSIATTRRSGACKPRIGPSRSRSHNRRH